MSDADRRPTGPGRKFALAAVFGAARTTKRRDGTPASALLSPAPSQHNPPSSLMGKLKKSKASPAPPSAVPTPHDEAVLDDLLAQLDAQQETNKPPSAKAPSRSATPASSSSD